MAVLRGRQVPAFGRPGAVTGSPRGRRWSRPRRSDAVFTPVTTHSSGREKVTVTCWCGHEQLNCSLQKLYGTSCYMLSEPCHVARPFSCTAVRQVPPSTVSRPPTEKAPETDESRSEPELSGSTVDPRVCEHGCALLSSGTSFWEARTDHWKPQGTSERARLACIYHCSDAVCSPR